MKFVNTVTGPIETDRLGDILCHEHIVCCSTVLRKAFGEKCYVEKELEDKAVNMLSDARACGVGCIIDGTPIDLGRDVLLLKRVSLRSGVAIIASSGVYHSEEPSLEGKDPEKFARYFIEECESDEGIENTGIKPGILKCATDSEGVTDKNKMLLSTMALVQRETKLPIFCHNLHAKKTPYGQIEIFRQFGVNLEQVVIGHASDSSDVEYLTDLLKYGCYLGFDRIRPSEVQQRAATITELIRRGYEDKILLSHDYFSFIDFGDTDWPKQKDAKSDRSFTNVHKILLPELRSLGISERQLHKLCAENPLHLLCNRP